MARVRRWLKAKLLRRNPEDTEELLRRQEDVRRRLTRQLEGERWVMHPEH